MTKSFLVSITAFLLFASCKRDLPQLVEDEIVALDDTIDFNFHVKPILSDKCFKCHGPDDSQRKGELRLDIRSNRLDRDEFVNRLIAHDQDVIMPPPESNLVLTAKEKAILIEWVNDGFDYKDHWSFLSPKKQKVPEIANDDWSQNEIDKFVLDKLNAVGYAPAAQADRNTLLRRVNLDITGLPPTIGNIQNYIANTSDKAYEQEIDKLLASDTYGERMALEWLDVSRYADTHGYQDDGYRTAWPYRDWVIKAYNDNLSYKDFLTWQLAGDLLDNPTDDQLLATCFNRNHPQTQEGGIVDEEYRVEYVADRVNTFGKALIGLTTECARCHDHKYDPISQKDYYGLYAYFNNNNESGIVPYNGEASPTVFLPSPESKKSIDSLGVLIDEYAEKMSFDRFSDDFEKWYRSIPESIPAPSNYKLLADFAFESEKLSDVNRLNLDRAEKPKRDKQMWYAYHNHAKNKLDASIWGDSTFRPLIVESYKGKGLLFNGDGGIRFNRDLDIDRNDAFSVGIWVKLNTEGIEGPIFNNSNGDFEGYRGWLCKLNKDQTLSFQLNHVWPDNAIDIRTINKIEIGKWTHITMTYDASSKAAGVGTYIDGIATENIILKDKLYKSLLNGKNKSNWSNMPFMIGMELRKSITDVEMDELKVFNRKLTSFEVKNLHLDKENIPTKELNKEVLKDYYFNAGLNQVYNELNDEIVKIKGDQNQLLTNEKEVMIMQEREVRRPTYILNRGAYDQLGDEVNPSVPSVFANGEVGGPKDRLALANWLFEESNPLTARVAVNRMWMMLFGKGIVATPEDFGNQGNLPTHPELLDYLALKFVEMDWDTKAFMKMIMMSATYQQSSKASEIVKEEDPGNLYYSHFPAYRLSAENIRDAALAGSGLLVKNIGGPSVYPYQPPGIWATLATRNSTKYVQQHGDSLYRRSMYTVWKRSAPPPNMMTFDAPDRYICEVRRQKTATPLQSLVLMNDPQYLEASRVLAANMIDSSQDIAQRFDYASKSLISRPLTDFENKTLQNQYQEFKSMFENEPHKIDPWINNGEHTIDDKVDKLELAANTVVASTIMNFDEFIMKR